MANDPKPFEKIKFEVKDSPLPFDPAGVPPSSVVDGQPVPTEPLLTVADVLGPDSPYRKIDPQTGETIIDTKGLHISHMDLENVRREINARIGIAEGLMHQLDDLAGDVERHALARGEEAVTICVDTKKNVNLRMAIRRLYGKKTRCITFKMYKQAVDLRSRVSTQDVNDIFEDFNLGDSFCAK